MAVDMQRRLRAAIHPSRRAIHVDPRYARCHDGFEQFRMGRRFGKEHLPDRKFPGTHKAACRDECRNAGCGVAACARTMVSTRTHDRRHVLDARSCLGRCGCSRSGRNTFGCRGWKSKRRMLARHHAQDAGRQACCQCPDLHLTLDTPPPAVPSPIVPPGSCRAISPAGNRLLTAGAPRPRPPLWQSACSRPRVPSTPPVI
jgi:hypothetical protein